MNKLNVLLGIIVLCFISLSCEKEETTTENKSLLIGQWQLTGLVNISDQDKYLNAVLEIKEGNEYANNEESGSQILNGIWINYDNFEELNLSSGIFENYPVDYRIIKNDSDSLILERHYTLGGKDAYLEYHYLRIN